MPTSRTSSSALDAVRHADVRTPAIERLVGTTPLIALRRSGDGFVHLKHEGLSAGGSFFDRVARAQLVELGSGVDRVCVRGVTSFTVSVLTLASARGLHVDVIIDRDPSHKRLMALCRAFGARFVRCTSEIEVDESVATLGQDGVPELRRDEAGAHRRALAELAREVIAASDGRIPQHWVLVAVGLERADLEDVLRGATGQNVTVHTVDDDGERRRTLSGRVASRRAQMGHREGLLLGPTGAEVADRAIDVGLSFGEPVVGIVPDGGQRYLGWW